MVLYSVRQEGFGSVGAGILKIPGGPHLVQSTKFKNGTKIFAEMKLPASVDCTWNFSVLSRTFRADVQLGEGVLTSLLLAFVSLA